MPFNRFVKTLTPKCSTFIGKYKKCTAKWDDRTRIFYWFGEFDSAQNFITSKNTRTDHGVCIEYDWNENFLPKNSRKCLQAFHTVSCNFDTFTDSHANMRTCLRINFLYSNVRSEVKAEL